MRCTLAFLFFSVLPPTRSLLFYCHYAIGVDPALWFGVVGFGADEACARAGFTDLFVNTDPIPFFQKKVVLYRESVVDAFGAIRATVGEVK